MEKSRQRPAGLTRIRYHLQRALAGSLPCYYLYNARKAPDLQMAWRPAGCSAKAMRLLDRILPTTSVQFKDKSSPPFTILSQ